MTAPLEKNVQAAIRKQLELRGCIVVAVPNGAHLAGDGKQRAMQMAALKRAGLSAGFPDLQTFNRDGAIGFIEVKREGVAFDNTNQIAWRDRLVNWHHRHAVMRSVDDVGETLAKWGWI